MLNSKLVGPAEFLKLYFVISRLIRSQSQLLQTNKAAATEAPVATMFVRQKPELFGKLFKTTTAAQIMQAINSKIG